MNLLPGNVVLVPLPVATGGMKLRPALIITELPGLFRDVLACGISTRMNQLMPNWDEIIETNDDDFSTSGLKHRSLIRLSHLHNVPLHDVSGVIGTIAPERLKRLQERLARQIFP